MSRVVKTFDINEKGISGTRLVNKETFDDLRSKIVILIPEESEVAAKLEIKEKGVFGVKFR